MTRTEENEKTVAKSREAFKNSNEKVVLLLADISKSLAVIADVMSGAQEPEKTSEEAKRVADEAFERIMRGDLTGGPNHAHH